MIDKEFLEHVGVLGMRWGRRSSGKSSGSSGKSSASSKRKGKTVSEDAASKNALKKKKVSELSNADIEKLTKRLQMEKQLKFLSPNAIVKGQKHVTTILAIGATVSTAYALYKSPVGQAVVAAVKNMTISNKAKWVV